VCVCVCLCVSVCVHTYLFQQLDTRSPRAASSHNRSAQAMHTYIFIYVCVYVCVYIFTHTYRYLPFPAAGHTERPCYLLPQPICPGDIYIYIYIYLIMCVCVRVSVCVRVCVCVHGCVCTYLFQQLDTERPCLFLSGADSFTPSTYGLTLWVNYMCVYVCV